VLSQNTIDWSPIIALANEHEYMGTIEREKYRVKQTAEVFTPTALVIDMVKKLPVDSFAPTKTVIDPACGDGQFLIVALGVKMCHFCMSREEALNDIYGVDLMRDNVDLCLRRLGGGNIIMGNTLDPLTPIALQTPREASLMREWFTEETNLEDFFL
jgi:hypothetical protein